MSPVRARPPRAPRSHPVKPGAQAPGLWKGTTASGKQTGTPRATGRDRAWRTREGHEARQRGTPPATTKAHGQLPSNNGRPVQQTSRAHTARNEPRHEKRCQATPAAIQTDDCAPGSEASPCRLRNSHHPDGRVCARRVPSPCKLQNSRRPDGRVRAWRVPSPCRLQTAAVRMESERPAAKPRTRNSQRNTPSEHTGEQEPHGARHRTRNAADQASTLVNRSQSPGHCTRNTTHRAGTLVNRSQAAQGTAHATQNTERAHLAHR